MLVCALWFGSFALDTVRLHKAGGGAEEPIYNQAFSRKLEPRHGLPPPRPQIAARSAAQINSEQRDKIQATALCRRAPRLSGAATARLNPTIEYRPSHPP